MHAASLSRSCSWHGAHVDYVNDGKMGAGGRGTHTADGAQTKNETPRMGGSAQAYGSARTRLSRDTHAIQARLSVSSSVTKAISVHHRSEEGTCVVCVAMASTDVD